MVRTILSPQQSCSGDETNPGVGRTLLTLPAAALGRVMLPLVVHGVALPSPPHSHWTRPCDDVTSP